MNFIEEFGPLLGYLFGVILATAIKLTMVTALNLSAIVLTYILIKYGLTGKGETK